MSISDVVGVLDSTCDLEADPARRWPSIFVAHFPPVQQHPKDPRLRRWEEDDERNTGLLGKKRNAS